ncbi:MAG TPA: DNA helicase RecG, partial [Acidimicrobiales bacterium]|nr:DNA helicase RecG [Acidimicrobiales bacterium]
MTSNGVRRLRQLDEVPVTRFKGVGDQKAKALADVGVNSVLDLVTYYPRSYVDRSRQVAISELVVGEAATVVGVVKRSTSRRTRAGRGLAEVEVFD